MPSGHVENEDDDLAAEEFGEGDGYSEESDDRPLDLTDVLPLEQIAKLELRLGVRLSALSVQFRPKPYSNRSHDVVVVRGELHAKNEAELDQSLDLVVTAYDDRGKVIATKGAWFNNETFYSLETFEIELEVYGIPAKLRLYPKAS